MKDLPEGKDQIEFTSCWIWPFVEWDSSKCGCLADSEEVCPYCKKVMEETA